MAPAGEIAPDPSRMRHRSGARSCAPARRGRWVPPLRPTIASHRRRCGRSRERRQASRLRRRRPEPARRSQRAHASERRAWSGAWSTCGAGEPGRPPSSREGRTPAETRRGRRPHQRRRRPRRRRPTAPRAAGNVSGRPRPPSQAGHRVWSGAWWTCRRNRPIRLPPQTPRQERTRRRYQARLPR